MTNTPLSRTLAEAANLISNSTSQGKIAEAAKASPLEDEFLTDLTNAQIAAIKPLMKSKNWDKLKAYLMSQKIVDKDFNNITKYKMDRDILSVLQRSFMDYHEQVEDIEEGAEEGADALDKLIKQLPAGVNLQKILKLISDHPSRDVNAKTDIKKAAAALAVDIKKIAHMVGNPDAKTIDAIALAIIRHDMVYAFPGGSIAVQVANNVRGIGKYSPVPPIKKSPGKYAFHSWIGMEGTKASLQEDEFITESTIEFMLDKKVVLRKRIKDAEVRRARDEWIKFGVLPYESNKEASEKYRKPWKVSTKFVPSGINQGPGYKAGQQRDAVIKESVEHVEEAVGDASSPEAMVRKFNKMTDVNDHTGAAILLATFLKDTKAMKCLKLVKQIHELEGSIPEGIFKYRTAWTTYLWKGFSMKYPQVNRNIINNEPR